MDNNNQTPLFNSNNEVNCPDLPLKTSQGMVLDCPDSVLICPDGSLETSPSIVSSCPDLRPDFPDFDKLLQIAEILNYD